MIGKAFLFLSFPGLVLVSLGHFFYHLSVSEIASLTLWYYFYGFLGVLFYPVLANLFPLTKDRGYGLSRLLSTLFLFWLNWILVSLRIVYFDTLGLFLCLLLVVLFAHFKFFHRHYFWDLLKRNMPSIFLVETLFFFSFLFFLIINSYHPEIYWGEKPMDFSLLNFSVRNMSLPYKDPWFSGKVMNYYYFGYYYFAGLIKMSGVSTEIGYPLAMASLPALLASGLYSLFLNLTKRTSLAFWGALLLVFSSNLKAFWAIAWERAPLNLSYFWSITRVFQNNLFAEYPSWSFLFFDLHPHVMSYPFVIVFLCFLHQYFIRKKEFHSRGESLRWFFFALSWGALLAFNTWDFILYSLLFLIMLFLCWGKCILCNPHYFFKRKELLQRMFIPLFIGIGVVFLYYPMINVLTTGKETIFYWQKNSATGWLGHFYHHGQWWLLIVLMMTPRFLKKRKIGWLWYFKEQGFLFSIFIGVLIIGSMAEAIVFMDRYNTIFKTFNQVYLLGGILAVASLRYFSFYWKNTKLIIFPLLASYVIGMLLLGSFFQIKAINDNWLFERAEASLKGSEYLAKKNPGDYKIIEWLRNHVRGTPTLVERYGRSFDHQTARISMHTGLPSYLGWDHHVYLRGASGADILKRKRDIDFIFQSHDPLKVYEFLLVNKIYFLVIGPIEKKFYQKFKGMDKFKQYNDLFIPLVKENDSVLYGVGSFRDYLK